MKKQVTIEVISGVEGGCIVIEDTRVAGPKPWGGGKVVNRWKTGSKDILSALGVSKELESLRASAAEKDAEIERQAVWEEALESRLAESEKAREKAERLAERFRGQADYHHDRLMEETRNHSDALNRLAALQEENVRRRSDDGHLAECPLCGSLDVGGSQNTVHCYGCGLSITKPEPLENAINAWNRRKGVPLNK